MTCFEPGHNTGRRKNVKDGKRSFAKNSMIIGALSRFSGLLRNRFDESFFGWLLCGNYRHEENGIIGLAGEKLKIRQRITVPFKRFNARAFENSLILRKTGFFSFNIYL